jgi:hypothetical protein
MLRKRGTVYLPQLSYTPFLELGLMLGRQNTLSVLNTRCTQLKCKNEISVLAKYEK